VVSDLVAGRVTTMLPTGEVVRTVRLPVTGGGGRELDLVAALSDGRVMLTSWQDRPNRGGPDAR